MEEEVTPAMAEFRKAMKTSTGREALLLRLSKGADIALTITDLSAWDPQPINTQRRSKESDQPSQVDQPKYPNISLLAKRSVTAGGCFVWANDTDLNDGSLAGHLLMATGQNDLWMASLYFSGDSTSRLKGAYLAKVNKGDDWARFFKEMRQFSASSECQRTILTMI